MKVAIDVKDRQEASAVKAAMEDPVMRATVIVFGILKQLPTDRARKRCVEFVLDKLQDTEEEAK